MSNQQRSADAQPGLTAEQESILRDVESTRALWRAFIAAQGRSLAANTAKETAEESAVAAERAMQGAYDAWAHLRNALVKSVGEGGL
jgi:hypothetical protein